MGKKLEEKLRDRALDVDVSPSIGSFLNRAADRIEFLKNEKIISKKNPISNRYMRKVIKYPKGAIVHFGDCDVYRSKICTCGLLMDLFALKGNQEDIYPRLWQEYQLQEEELKKLLCQKKKKIK